MATKNYASRDANFVPTLSAVSSADNTTIVRLVADPITGRLLVDLSGGIAALMQTDTFTATNNQTIFTASKPIIGYTFYLSLNGAIQTPSSDYTVAGNVATLTAGVPSGTIVLWLYATA
jgi:hypothetical protein